MAFEVTELREGIGIIFVEAMRRRDAITSDMWLAAREERRLRAAAERMLRHYRHVVKKTPAKYARRLATSREACKRYRAKRRIAHPPSKLRRVPDEMRNRIVQLSVEGGLSQRAIAAMVGVRGPTVCRILKAERAARRAA